MVNSRKTLGVAGAAAMAFLAGANTAHAAFNLKTGAGKVAYAKESITTTQTISGVDYRVISGPASGPGAGRLRATTTLDVSVTANSSNTATFTLGNMVFIGTNRPSLIVDGTTFTPTTSTGANSGAEGETTVRFTLTRATAFASGSSVQLRIRSVGLAPGAVGSVSMSLENAGGNERQADSLEDAVRIESGLRESGDVAIPKALLSEGFRKFSSGGNVRSDGLAASVGQLDVDALGRYPDADGIALAVATDGTAVNALGDVIDADASTVTIEGDVSFLTGVFWSDNLDCDGDDPAPTNQLTIATGDVRTLATESVTDADEKHLCIEVDGVTPIPRTASYKLTLAYTGITGASFSPAAAEVALGGVTRGGATARIPYLTIFRDYNQRIVMVNRGSEPAAYAFEFIEEGHPTRNTTPVPLDRATGTLQPGVTSLRARDVLDFTEESDGRKWVRAGAVLFVDASPDLIDVATNQVNTAAGFTTDTVKYTVE